VIVVDANVLVYFSVHSEQSALAEAVLAVDSDWAVPTLWRAEFRSTLIQYLRAKKLTMHGALLSWKTVLEIVQAHEYEVKTEDVLRLAESSGCSAYDCEYVAVAEFLNAPLVASDKQVLRAFPKIAVTMEQFVKRK
jgi:predicted nucleic acid-binding protein